MFSKRFRFSAGWRGAATLVLCAVCISCSWFQRYRVLTTLPAGEQGNSIVILEDVYYDNGRRLYYQVKNGEKVVVDRHFICSQLDTDKHSNFKTITAREGNLVAVFQESRPDSIIVLHDFASHQTWPAVLSDSESYVETRNRGNALLALLQQEHTNLKLKLNELECD
jgi:hypothetical protein